MAAKIKGTGSAGSPEHARNSTKMATALGRRTQAILQRIYAATRHIQQQNPRVKVSAFGVICGSTIGGVLSWYFVRKHRQLSLANAVYAKEHSPNVQEMKAQAVQTQRELRFLSFASAEYDGQVYMTPQDFLESLMDEAPRPRAGRTRLRREEVQRFLKDTPPRKKGTINLFRNIHDRGLISYTEYLFLLCVLTKPKSGFGIAFNMFDIDGNQRVDKKEFLVLIDLFSNSFDAQTMKATSQQKHSQNIWTIVRRTETLERIITQAQKVDREKSLAKHRSLHDGQAAPLQDTTLTVHFFGPRGTDVLKYEDFHSFMENLQTEVLELEFNEFAKGMPTITEEEFASILLRYTTLDKDDQAKYINRLQERLPNYKGITFKDFKEFGQFLNSLDDFSIAMRIYTFADQPISEGEFKRAVKVCTGQNLNDHLVHTVFQLFDIDGDGHLSHKEFISVMKDRLHRGLKASNMINLGHWENFKMCVKNEIKHMN